MSIRDVFKAFSLRTQAPAQPVKKLTPEFRARVMMLCRDAHPHSEFWDEIHQKMTYRLGRPRLVNSEARSRAEDVLYFLESCDDKYFLDFIEYIFTC